MNVVKEKLSEAASVSQDAAAQAAKVTKEYAAAGAQKTQEIYNEYVAPNAAAGRTKKFFYALTIQWILFRCRNCESVYRQWYLTVLMVLFFRKKSSKPLMFSKKKPLKQPKLEQNMRKF